MVSEVATVFNKVLKVFHVVLECPNSFNSSVFHFCYGEEGAGAGHYISAKVRDSENCSTHTDFILSSCISFE